MLEKPESRTITVALAGAPNVGKSTVFNLLTGLSQHVGNWPGKTVEQKIGKLHHDNFTLQIVDLPGTYSLTANSVEEQIARDYLIKENPDIVVAVLNAASLERNLYLVAELIELAPRLIIALNMIDVAQQQGMKIDCQILAAKINTPVVPIVANKNNGLDELVKIIIIEYSLPVTPLKVKHIEYGNAVEEIINHVAEMLNQQVIHPYPRHWTAMKLLEGDTQINKFVRSNLPTEQWHLLEPYLRENESAAVTIATLRYEWITRIMATVLSRPPIGRVSFTEKIDRAATHPTLGLLVLMALLGIIFTIVYNTGVPLQSFLEVNVIERCQALIDENLVFLPVLVQSFLVNGILKGVGILLTFIPLLFIFFVLWALVEDIGYTARAAFVTDRFMHFLGLHGKSCLPLILGFGCNVPAVLGTRIIDSERARLLTILIAPLVPCAARMAVVAVIAAAFFGEQAIFVSLGTVVLSLLILVIAGLVLNKFVIHGESNALIMELPLYHIPKLPLVGMIAWQNIKAFIQRAGTVILLVSITVWILSVIPNGDINESLLAQIGRLLEPVGNLMGLNWQMMVALVSSFVAKENTIATLEVLMSGQGRTLSQQLNTLLTPASALAFLVVQVLFIPCVATIAAIRHETGSWRWPFFTIALQLIISFSLAILIFQIARLII